MAVAPEQSVEKLRKFLLNHRVSPAIAKYMMDAPPDGMGMEAISDFASYFTQSTFEDGCKTRIAENTADKDNAMAVGRLRTAWRMAQGELNKAVTEIQAGKASSEDWDLPLKEEEELQRKDACDKAYDNLQYDAESQPAATLVGRSFREFANPKRELTLMPLKRMRSEAEYRNHPQNKRQKLLDAGEGIELTYNRTTVKFPDLDFQTLLQVTAAMKLMSNMWTMTGAMIVDSKQEYDAEARAYKKVRMIHMSQSMSYSDFFMRKAMEHPGQPDKVIAWLLDRDRQTRAKARQLFLQGWPWGEALLHSRDVLCQVLWTCGAKGIAHMQTAVIGEAGEDEEMDEAHEQKPLTNRERQRLRQLEAAEQQRKQNRDNAPAPWGKGGAGSRSFAKRQRRRNKPGRGSGGKDAGRGAGRGGAGGAQGNRGAGGKGGKY